MVLRARGPDFSSPQAPADGRALIISRLAQESDVQDVKEEPLFVERACGLDIAKAEVEATIRVPSVTHPGRRQQESRTFGTTRNELLALADWLACWKVTKVGTEATGD